MLEHGVEPPGARVVDVRVGGHDIEIAGEIIRNEHRQNRQSADPAGLTVRELLRVNGLRNVRYTLDESEPVELR